MIEVYDIYIYIKDREREIDRGRGREREREREREGREITDWKNPTRHEKLNRKSG